METRVYKGTSVRAASGADFVIEGTAASYNVLSNDLGGFREQIAPGAFDLSLSSPDSDVRCLVNHEPSLILGRTKSGTLKVWADSTGLQYRCQLDKTNSAHQSTFASIKRGDLSECSFAFVVPDGGDEWNYNSAPPTRTLRNVTLMDVSAVTYPAYGQPGSTQVSARALKLATKSKPIVRTSGKPLPRLTRDPKAPFYTDDEARAMRIKLATSVVEADKRDLTAEEVSSAQKWTANQLSMALQQKGYSYLKHDAQYAYALPEDVFFPDPDMLDSDAMSKARKCRYSFGLEGTILGEFEDISDADDDGTDDDVRCYWKTLENLRDAALLKVRMRGTAGIFAR